MKRKRRKRINAQSFALNKLAAPIFQKDFFAKAKTARPKLKASSQFRISIWKNSARGGVKKLPDIYAESPFEKG